MGYFSILAEWMGALACGEQAGSSIGVWIFKLPADHPFQRAAKRHDEAYRLHDWHNSTEKIDQQLLADCLIAAGDNKNLISEAFACYRIARLWGRMRYGLAQVGVRDD